MLILRAQVPVKTFAFTTGQGIPMLVRIVQAGDGYGRYDAGEWALRCPLRTLLVEFYDARYTFTPFGQFITRYYFDTMINREWRQGLMLDGDVRDWDIEPASGLEVEEFLKQWAAQHLAYLQEQDRELQVMSRDV